MISMILREKMIALHDSITCWMRGFRVTHDSLNHVAAPRVEDAMAAEEPPPSLAPLKIFAISGLIIFTTIAIIKNAKTFHFSFQTWTWPFRASFHDPF